MRITHRRLASASLEHPINDPADRNVMPMSTLIASEQWLLETSWDGASIGDVQIFKNASCGQNGVRTTIDSDETDERGRPKQIPKPDEWIWWGGVPRGRIKSYRFTEEEHPRPMTMDEGLPFELPNAQRKEKPEQAGKGGSATA